jgi:hypothetical protein
MPEQRIECLGAMSGDFVIGSTGNLFACQYKSTMSSSSDRCCWIATRQEVIFRLYFVDTPEEEPVYTCVGPVGLGAEPPKIADRRFCRLSICRQTARASSKVLREISMKNSFSGNYDVMRGKTHGSLKSPECSCALDHFARFNVNANHSVM